MAPKSCMETVEAQPPLGCLRAQSHQGRESHSCLLVALDWVASLWQEVNPTADLQVGRPVLNTIKALPKSVWRLIYPDSSSIGESNDLSPRPWEEGGRSGSRLFGTVIAPNPFTHSP